MKRDEYSQIRQNCQEPTPSLQKSEGFAQTTATKGDAVVNYCESLATTPLAWRAQVQDLESSGFPS